MTEENRTESPPVPKEVSAMAFGNAMSIAHLNLEAALEEPSKNPSANEVRTYVQKVAIPLERSMMLLMRSTGESLLLFHSEQERKTAYAALRGLPSLVQKAEHVVYNHKEPMAALVDGKVYALKIGAALATELAGIDKQGSINLPIKTITTQDDMVRAYREFAQNISKGIIRV